MDVSILLEPIKQPRRVRDRITSQRIQVSVDGNPVFGPQEVPLEFASGDAPHVVTGLKAGQRIEVRRAVTDRSGIWSDDTLSSYVVEEPADTDAPAPPPGATFSSSFGAEDEDAKEPSAPEA